MIMKDGWKKHHDTLLQCAAVGLGPMLVPAHVKFHIHMHI